MPWSVQAKRNKLAHPGFRRDGRLFLKDAPTILADDEMTDAILNEPQLIVIRIDDEPTPPPVEPEAAEPEFTRVNSMPRPPLPSERKPRQRRG